MMAERKTTTPLSKTKFSTETVLSSLISKQVWEIKRMSLLVLPLEIFGVFQNRNLATCLSCGICEHIHCGKYTNFQANDILFLQFFCISSLISSNYCFITQKMQFYMTNCPATLLLLFFIFIHFKIWNYSVNNSRREESNSLCKIAAEVKNFL